MRNETVCMGKTLLAGLALLWAWTAVAEDVVVNITSAEDDYVIASTDDPYAQALLAGDKANRLYKVGGGRLVINCDFLTAGWKGELRVHEGFVRLQNDNALGTSDGGVVIDKGASLELDPVNGKAQLFAFENENLTFEGVGADGEGVPQDAAHLQQLERLSQRQKDHDGRRALEWHGRAHGCPLRYA